MVNQGAKTSSITVNQVQAKRDAGEPMLIVDVRSQEEYASGHVPGALCIPLEEVEGRLEDLPASCPVVVVCHSGKRAQMACERVSSARSNLMRMEGGTLAWIDAGLPVVRSAQTTWSIERQTRFVLGLLFSLGGTLSLMVSPSWAYLPIGLGVALSLGSVLNLCGLGLILLLMPWNRSKK